MSRTVNLWPQFRDTEWLSQNRLQWQQNVNICLSLEAETKEAQMHSKNLVASS
jgi:hypothetical protein